MKKIMKLLTGTTLAFVLLASCKKYDDGPAFSFRSKKERVTNVWKINYAYDYKDSVNITSDYAGETWDFTNGGDFVERDNSTIDKTGNGS